MDALLSLDALLALGALLSLGTLLSLGAGLTLEAACSQRGEWCDGAEREQEHTRSTRQHQTTLIGDPVVGLAVGAVLVNQSWG